MGVVVDTSVVIAVEHDLLADEHLKSDDAEPFVLAAITASELLHGVFRAKSAVMRMRREQFVEGVLAELSIVPFDLAIARVHAQLGAELREAGTAIGESDLMIAATAVWLDYRVATRDLRSFPRIRGLRVVRW